MNTANKLTIARILLIPVYLLVLYIGFRGSNLVAMAIFIIASLTDLADGYIARSRNEETEFGVFADPLADKILVVSAMLWFVEKGTLPGWVALIVIIREFMVTALRLIAVGSGRVIAAGITGKVKTVVTMICLSAMHINMPRWILYYCFAAISATTIVSGIEYYVKNFDVLKLQLSNR
ncbi:MAG: CDP-diacylglycerol--glycerol-3-phosphate 3-phosphatidyltransferase [Oscillospiraceae bacterium]|nr:CDP-diacylglycerol--glycerol-3-phosphate 3-phosphatidyltransferase [Oscillospiraceae bacterium]